MSTPIEEMTVDAQAALVASRHDFIQQMIKDGGHDFRCSLCFGHECENILQIAGVSRGNTDARKKIDALHCAKCDRTFCPNCIGTSKGCNVQLCYGCDPILEFTFKEDSKDAIGEIFCATEGHCASCTAAMFPKMIQSLDDAKYRDAMRHLYSKSPRAPTALQAFPMVPTRKDAAAAPLFGTAARNARRRIGQASIVSIARCSARIATTGLRSGTRSISPNSRWRRGFGILSSGQR